MPSPSASTAVIAIIPSADVYINSLLGDNRWVSPYLTYSFPGYTSRWSTDPLLGYGPSSGDDAPWSSAFAPLSLLDQLYFDDAVDEWTKVANITLTKIFETSTNVGDIRVAYTDAGDAAAYAYLPYAAPVGGDIWFDAPRTGYSDSWLPGDYLFFTAMHELGHALGLKHPFEDTPTLPASLDSQSYTIMSYSAQAGNQDSYFSFYPTTPMVLDIAAIQYLYGANRSYHTGNDTYSFSDATTYHQTIWDAGGTDTLQYTGRQAAQIDLGAGADSTIGNPVYIQDVTGRNLSQVGNIWIAQGVTIENAIGGAGADTIVGNAANNDLSGGAGNDTLYGGAGNDRFDWDSAQRGGNDLFYGGTGDDEYVLDSASDRVIENAGEGTDEIWVSFSYSLAATPEIEALSSYATIGVTLTGNARDNVFSGSGANDVFDGGAGIDLLQLHGTRAAYTYTRGDVSSLSSAGTLDGTDSLVGIERLQFSDSKLALDVDDHAGEAMKFLGAVAPDFLNNLAARGQILRLFDAGETMATLCQKALDLHLVPSTNTELVDTVFRNVLNADPSPEVRNSLVAYIQSHGQADFVSAVAELAINVNLVGLSQSGIDYV